MASPLNCLLLILSLIFISSTSTALATSRKSLHDAHKKEQISLRIPLTRIDSDKNLTKSELIKRSLERTRRKFQRLDGFHASSLDASTTVQSSGGEFLMDIGIGSPATSYKSVMDTGSDLIWTQCEPCEQCYNQPFPIFNPQSSSSFQALPCSSQFCQALPQSTCDYSSNECDYQYGYGDQSSIQGYLGSETMTLGGSAIPNIAFGCSNNNQGTFAGSGAAGIVGTGYSPLSLPNQLGVSEFSYCLTTVGSSDTSTFYLGSSNPPSGTQMTTTVSVMQYRVYYYITCLGMSVGGQQVASSDDFAFDGSGNGGMIIDSGTTITQVPSDVMQNLQNVIPQVTGLSLTDSDSGLPLCLQQNDYDSGTSNLPSLVMNLQGMDLELSGDNLWIAPSDGVICLAISTMSGLPTSILGNIQQQNYFINYNIPNQALTFIQTNCAGN